MKPLHYKKKTKGDLIMTYVPIFCHLNQELSIDCQELVLLNKTNCYSLNKNLHYTRKIFHFLPTKSNPVSSDLEAVNNSSLWSHDGVLCSSSNIEADLLYLSILQCTFSYFLCTWVRLQLEFSPIRTYRIRGQHKFVFYFLLRTNRNNPDTVMKLQLFVWDTGLKGVIERRIN